MIKTKIQKIVPWWLIGLLLAVSAQWAGAAAFSNKQQPVETQAQIEPMVLGESITLRGQREEEKSNSLLRQIGQLDLKPLGAKNALVFDLDSGQNLIQKNIGQKLPIASLTKLLSALVAYNRSDLNLPITVTKADLIDVNPSLGLAVGDRIKALDAFNAMLIGSENDAALTLARYTAGSRQAFVDLMNSQAQNLNMADSHFSNPLGFDSELNYSTAGDLKKLITATESLAAFKVLGKRQNYEFSGSLKQVYKSVATNKLIGEYPDLDAIKTGYTPGALGAMATKLSAFGHQIIILVLASPDRERDTLWLRRLVLENFAP